MAALEQDEYVARRAHPSRRPSATESMTLRESLELLGARGSAWVGNWDLPKHSVVYSQGEVDRRLYILKQGWIKTVVNSPRGKECLLGIYGPGDVFGELMLVSERRTETAIAMARCTVGTISWRSTPSSLPPTDVMRSLLSHVTFRMAEQQLMISDLVTMQSEQRLASTLLRLARRFGHRAGDRLRLDAGLVTQQELSEMVGTTRSRVGFFIRRFCERGMLSRVDGYLLLCEAGFESYLESEE